jgi:hypothetical protein
MLESYPLRRPHCLVAQDVALSRPKRRFESGWGHLLFNPLALSDPRGPKDRAIEVSKGQRSDEVPRSGNPAGGTQNRFPQGGLLIH